MLHQFLLQLVFEVVTLQSRVLADSHCGTVEPCVAFRMSYCMLWAMQGNQNGVAGVNNTVEQGAEYNVLDGDRNVLKSESEHNRITGDANIVRGYVQLRGDQSWIAQDSRVLLLSTC